MEPEAGLVNRKADAQQWLDDLRSCWRALQKDQDLSAVRLAGLVAMEAAFVLGCLVGESGGGDQMRKELQARRMEPALQAIKANSVQRIIESAAHDLWARHPWYKDQPSSTTGKIYENCIAQIQQLPKVPPRWVGCALPQNGAKVKHAIYKRVRRLTPRLGNLKGA